MAVTLTACDNMAPGAAVPAGPARDPGPVEKRAGERPLWRKRRTGWGVLRMSMLGQERQELEKLCESVGILSIMMVL